MSYTSNYKRFQKDNPGGAIKLGFIDTSTHEITSDHNLKSSEHTYHDANPKEEAKQWFSKLALKNSHILYVFGVGLGHYFEASRHWLDESQEHHIVFLEDDLAVLYHFLHTQTAGDLLRHPRAHLYYFDGQPCIDQMTWKFVLKQISVSALKLYAKNRKQTFATIKSKLLYESAMKNDVVDEFMNGGAAFFKNFYPNLLQLNTSFNAQKLFNQFKNVPAIICGAGPSLQKNQHLLPKLSDKALIFAGGSAMNAVNAFGFQPHFGVGIDPNSEQFKRYKEQQAEGVPVFYRSRLEHRAFETISGPRLYVKGAGVYPLASWFDEKLGIEGPVLDEGHNVSNFSAEIAVALGCNPIILVGLDLAFTDLKTYAEGVVEENAFDESQFNKDKPFELTAQLKEDIYGNKVYTLWKWQAEAEWLSGFAANNKEVQVINASEGGLGMEEIENLTLEQVSQKYLKEEFGLADRIQKEIEHATFQIVSLEKIKESIKELQTSLRKCVDLISALETAENISEEALAEVDLIEQPGYYALLEVFDKVYEHVHPFDKKGKYSFLKRVAEENLSLIKSYLNT